MTFTTTSEETLSIQDLNLVFKLRHYQNRSIKGTVSHLFANPIESILRPKESFQALKGINLNLRKGDRLGVLGVNGSGKTTLCRCIAGMLHPDSGLVRMQGHCRAIFDINVGVIPELTGRENARLLGRLMYPQITQRELLELVEDTTAFSELDGFLDAPFDTYSKGMKARMFLSIATAKASDILILDEIYDNTDEFFQRKMTARLMKFIEMSSSVIFVSHSSDQIRSICNRAIVLHQSKIAYDGTVEGAMFAYRALNEGLHSS